MAQLKILHVPTNKLIFKKIFEYFHFLMISFQGLNYKLRTLGAKVFANCISNHTGVFGEKLMCFLVGSESEL